MSNYKKEEFCDRCQTKTAKRTFASEVSPDVVGMQYRCGCGLVFKQNNMNKSFGSLSTQEVAELSPEEIISYLRKLGSDSGVLEEVDLCRKRLDDAGIKYYIWN